MRNKVPFLLALIGGILLWIAGATGSVGIAGTITQILASIPELAPFVDILNLIYYISCWFLQDWVASLSLEGAGC
jgi:hypothetical protein